MSNPFKSHQPYISESFQRKMYLLEGQNITLVQQLQSLRQKLGHSQDIQGKYELLLGQSENQNRQLRLQLIALEEKLQHSIEMIIEDKQLELEENKRKLQHEHKHEVITLKQQHQQQRQEQDIKYQQLKALYETLAQKAQQIDLFAFKMKNYQKQVQQLQNQLHTQQQTHQANHQRQIASLKLNLTQKLNTKHQSQTHALETQLKHLQRTANDLQLQNDLLQEQLKNSAIAQSSSNLQKLTHILTQTKNLTREDNSKLEQALDKANSTLRELIEEKYHAQQAHSQQVQQLRLQIKQLQQQLVQKEKTHTQQIFTLTQKHLALTEQYSQEHNQYLSSVKQKFQLQQLLWNSLAEDHASQINKLRQDNQRNRVEFEQQKHRLKLKIKDLKQRLEDYGGKKFEGETQQMITSLKDIDSKEDHIASYQHGITFFQRQLAKANAVVAKKDIQIAKLLEEITKIRNQNQAETSSTKDKYKTQKKQFLDKVFTLENQLSDLSDKLRFKERELMKKQKDSSFNQIQLQKRIEALQDLNNQIKKDYERAVSTCKTLQQEYRGERDRGVSAKGDANYAKRIKWLQLQKQKNQLSIIFREKQEQMKILYEKQIDQLRNQRDTLKQKATLLEDDNKRMARENDDLMKRVQKENAGGKTGSKKAGEMEKKIASLNLEISLTKNLFENLEKAKSRLKARDQTERAMQQSEPSQVQENEEEHD